MNPAEIKFTGDTILCEQSTLLEFWKWAFSDLCDDDIKGIFAEWMVGLLLGLPLARSRRVSWADSDIILPSGIRIEVKASAVWQSWKLVNEDGSAKPLPASTAVDPRRIRFGGLQARSAVTPVPVNDESRFKSDYYVFCMHMQTDPASWGAWNLAHWEFYFVSRHELAGAGIGKSVSLAKLREIVRPMTARQFQQHARQLLDLPSGSLL
ncbi:hypothetical protein [Geobacter sp.]|uniref:hypothetical protein n=1 Tax=Geobacter sp. TaxID=46610 RepID=UPI0027BA7E47|nr:hypothetical protein [Geobacter sp.]